MTEATASTADADVRRAVRSELSLLRIATMVAVGTGCIGILLIYGPIVWLGLMSISERPLTGKPGPFTLGWYEKLFTDLRWVSPLGDSLAVAAIVCLLCMLTATAVGRVLPHVGARGAWLLLIFLVVLFVPGVVLGVDFIMYYRLFLGIRTGLWSLVLGHFIWAFPFALLSLLVVSSRFDIRLLEVAADLGASRWRRFRDIEVPLLMPGILSAGFFGFLLSFNELPRSIYLRGGITTLPLFQWAETASHTTLVPLVYALSTLITLGSLGLTVVALQLLFRGERPE